MIKLLSQAGYFTETLAFSSGLSYECPLVPIRSSPTWDSLKLMAHPDKKDRAGTDTGYLQVIPASSFVEQASAYKQPKDLRTLGCSCV